MATVEPPPVPPKDYEPGMAPTPASPAAAQVNDDVEHVVAHEEEKPTESHALADTEMAPEEKGYAQHDHGDVEVKDLGWQEPPENIPTPLVNRLPNEELWTLVRRFNKQMYHVKSIPEPPIGGLDLNIADEEEFSPDKLRANIERLYMTVIVGSIGVFKHIARLRSWKERNRTLAFLTVYTIAWMFDFLVPTIIAFLMVLIVFPPARTFCFPPAPLALIDASTGTIKKPTAGVLASDDSLTGAPEKHQGEAVEQEASNFVNAFTAIAISSAAGKDHHEKKGDEDSSLEKTAPDPTDVVMKATDAQTKAAGDETSNHHDKTKEPMSAAMWSKTRPVMHALADIADGWERFGNALSPTPPFPRHTPRLKLAGVLAPVLLVSLFTTSYMVMKGSTFIIGAAFFSDPLIWKGLAWLNTNFPDWPKYLEIRNTLLKGIPTDAQLTVTLLRIGENNKAPLPPPPRGGAPPPNAAQPGATEGLEHLDEQPGVSQQEINAAVLPDENTAKATGTDENADKKKKKHRGHRILAMIKGTTKGGVETMLGTDRLKAAAGLEHAKNRLGIVQNTAPPPAGPVDFPARWKGKKGHAFITATATSPALSWTTNKEDVEPVWSVPIADIQEIKKVGGLGWKAKMVVAWATDREIADGILIIDRHGKQYHLTAISLRDELFNRLISIGSQMWEAW